MTKVFITKVEKDLESHLLEALTFLEWEKIVPPNSRIFFKPNLTYPTPKEGVTTTPAFMDAVLKVFKQRTQNLIVGESDGGYQGWPAEIAFETHGLPEICQRYGARLVNLSRETNELIQIKLSKGIVNIHLPSLLLHEIDVFVTLPVPKIHQVTTISGAIKNQWGCIPDNMRLTYHPYFDEMILEINRLVNTQLALVDGTYFLNRSGPLDGEPLRQDILLASDNIGAIDAALSKLMHLDISRVCYLREANRQGWIPASEEVEYNLRPELFNLQEFTLELTMRNRIVRWAFDRQWAIRLVWNSWVGDLLHKIMYAVLGNPVRDATFHALQQSKREK